MPDFYRLTSPNGVDAAIVLETNDAGEATKKVSTGLPVQLNADQRKLVESLGYGLEAVDKEDAESAQVRSNVGGDVVGTAPTFGTSTPPQTKDKDK